MNKSGMVLVLAVLMLSACGKQSEVDTKEVAIPVPIVQNDMPEAIEQPVPSVVKPAAKKMVAPAVVSKTAPPVKQTASVSSTAPSHEEEMNLAKKSGCLACHKIEKKLVGPAWNDVSKRYKGDAKAYAQLVEKVKKGGKGNWTEVTGGAPMPPYSPRVTDENIGKLVKFILSL